MASLERSSRYHAALNQGRRLLQAPGVRLIGGVALSSLCLYLALRQVSFSDTARLLGRARWEFVGLALLMVVANLLVKIWRWEVLLGRPVCRGNHWRIANVFLSAQLLNAVFPIRTGEVSRVIVLGQTTALVSSVVLEKAIDILAYGLLFVISLFLITLPGWLSETAPLFLALAVMSVLALTGLFFWRRKVAGLLVGWAEHLPQPYASRVQHQLQLAFASLEALAAPAPLLRLALSTVLIWGSALLINYLAGLGLGITLPGSAVIVLLVALQAGITLPSLPISVGIFELVCVWVLQYIGFSQPAALSYGILLHVIVYLPIILLGAAAMLILPFSARLRAS